MRIKPGQTWYCINHVSWGGPEVLSMRVGSKRVTLPPEGFIIEVWPPWKLQEVVDRTGLKLFKSRRKAVSYMNMHEQPLYKRTF